ncbi:MAG: DPP IV N-terminal domain-containing protein [Phycisphaerae bacterium]|nr:DPP IV N-terminal domain-containing protein [Phycisphaerae bacterium]
MKTRRPPIRFLFRMLGLQLLVALSALGASWGCSAARPAGADAPIDTSFLLELSVTRNYSNGRPSRISLTPDGSAVLFLRSGPRDVVQSLYEMDVATQEVRCFLRAEDLLAGKREALSAEERAARERSRESRQGLTWYELSQDGASILTGLSGDLYVIRRADGHITKLARLDQPARDARFSPDGQFVSCIRGYDLHVINLKTNEDSALTTGGTQDRAFGTAEFVAAEEMDRRTGYWWTGDSRHLAYTEVDQTQVPTRYIFNPIHPNDPAQGWRYPNAGASNARVRLGIVSVTGGDTSWVEWDSAAYPYLATVRSEKDMPLTMYVQTRDQTEAILYRIDATTGEKSELLREHDDAWINIDPSMPKWIDEGSRFLWTSERTGETRLELRDDDGRFVNAYAFDAARFAGVVSVQHARKELVARVASRPGQSQLVRLRIDGSGAVRITEGVGSHGGTFSRDGDNWVHSASLVDGREILAVRNRGGEHLVDLPSEAQQPPFMPNVEWTQVRFEGREFEAVIQRPRDFRPGRKYPVIESVYGGPGHSVVSSAARSYLRNQWMADQGFIVVQCDTRGTPGRDRDWERTIKGDVIDTPLQEHAGIVTELCRRYGEMDARRIGIYGWSFGGYFSAMAVLRQPSVYHAAVAGAPVTDWIDYDTHYTERYLGVPPTAEDLSAANGAEAAETVAEAYRRCDANTYAEQLTRPLLLIHGTTDDNVYFQHTLKLHDALFRAGRHHELLVLSGFTHMVPDPIVTTRLNERIVRFFKMNL